MSKNKGKNTISRGPTGVDLPPSMQGTEKNLVSASREDKAHSSGRPTRVSMSNMKKLQVPPSILEDGYYYRFFQDKEGRIEQAKAAYYEHVTDEQGNNYTRRSGPHKMHLMRLKQEYRDADDKLKMARVAATLEQEAQIGANEYAPNGGKSAIKHHTSDTA